MKTNIHNRWALGALFFAAVGFSSISNAALVGRLPTTPGGIDYQAYYDTDANLTWLADANYAKTTFMNWDYSDKAWLARLNVGGITGWSLSPLSRLIDSTCSRTNGVISWGYNCTGSDIGNLFYNVLGGVAGKSIATTHNANYDLFSNIQTDHAYFLPHSGILSYVSFYFKNGRQDTTNLEKYVWPVYRGDVEPPAPPAVSAVPVPAAIWLFGSGLLGFIDLAKRGHWWRNHLTNQAR